VFTKLWPDPEVEGRIYLQAQALFADQIAGADKDKLYGEILFDVMHKLSAVKFHLEIYRRTERVLYEQHVEAFRRNPNENAECFPLIFAFEGFMFQMKSCLDMLVKIFEIVPMPNNPKTQTYGDKGENLLKALEASRDQYEKFIQEGKTAFSKKVEQVDAMVQLVEEARDGWLAEAVGLRDTISHYSAAKHFLFKPMMTGKGIDAAKPTLTHHGKVVAPVTFLQSVYTALVAFAQDFMCRALHLRMRLPVQLSRADQTRAEAFGGKQYAQFIKWEWTMNGEAVRGIFNTGSAE
jgi:hypothetical protein